MSTGFYFYNPSEQKVFVSRNAIFLEEDYSLNESRTKVTLEEQNDKPMIVTSENNEEQMGSDNDPFTYQEAMNDKDVEHWKKTMESEMDSMYINQVWTLVDKPESIKPIGCKWIYKRKLGPTGKVETYKARLVAKGYTQKASIDYEETFSPVTMLKSIRILLSIAAHYDYEIWQMDVKTAFLNGYIREEIYMDQSVGAMSSIKMWLSSHFAMKDLGEASYILRIKLFRDRKKRLLGLSQVNYIDKILARFSMQDSKKGFSPFRHGVRLSKKMCSKTQEEREKMRNCPYALAIGSLMYAMLCTRPDICYASDIDDRKSISGFVFTLGKGAISWRSCKQDTTADSTTEAEYIAASEAAKEAVWIRKFIQEFGVVPSIESPITIHCDNNGAIANAVEPRAHKRTKHIEHRFHLIHDIIHKGDVEITHIASANNVADPFTKALPQKVFEKHLDTMGVKYMYDWF
uniref:Reverse transcriptase Ty1/copia-type domain-containing protein n=1 Tax=Fagus sylvatica TaxID=28930 RepID=A0A2N9EWE6_FAGSY